MSDHEQLRAAIARTSHPNPDTLETELTTLATTPEALDHITRQLHVMAERSHQ